MNNLDELVINLTHLMNHKDKVPQQGFIELMEKILCYNPSLGWELGPSPLDSDVDMLSISTSNKDELYEIHNLNIFPIDGSGWQIVLGVPPRNWEMFFHLPIENDELEVDASKWFYAASWKNDCVEIEIAGLEQNLVDKGNVDEALKILLIGELGEWNLRKFVQRYEFFDGKIDERFKPIKGLRNSFSNYFDHCSYKTLLTS